MAPKAVYRGTRNDWLLADVQCQHVAVRARDDVFPCVIEPRGDAVAWLMAEHDQVDLQRFGELLDRKSVVSGKSVSVRVDLGGRRILKKKILYTTTNERIIR